MRQPKPWRTRAEAPTMPGPDVADYFRSRFEAQALAKRTGQVLAPEAPTHRDFEEWARAARRPEPPLPAAN
ncbi:hypothetical protein [Mycolicibacterium fortuitum]|uniref:hypothetical protein n=1 Tax=Mycolicibacterium fortuitum TaxID=1766 RepID=UPI0010427C64|nr:hypothetical protein [Mycolicibacterium fortuitum]